MGESDTDALKHKPLNILLAEDSEADVKITLRAFRKAKFQNNIFVVNTGQEALDYVRGKDQYKDRIKYPRPDLILLDLNMPKVDGFQVLKEIKSDPYFNYIPVIVLTSSENQKDVIQSYKNGAASYIQKPVDYEEFVNIIEGFNFYWHVANLLPSKEAIEG